MKRHATYLVFILISCVTVTMITGCAVKYEVMPQMKEPEFVVAEKFGSLAYSSMTDSRGEIDRKGKVGNGCNGVQSGITHLGDKDYKIPLVFSLNASMKESIRKSDLFTEILSQPSEDSYTFDSNLERFHILIDQVNAQNTQACAGGGLLGMALAAGVEVTATGDVQITGRLKKGNEEIWRHTITKQVVTLGEYGSSKQNAENCIGKTIGEACNEMVNALAMYLNSK